MHKAPSPLVPLFSLYSRGITSQNEHSCLSDFGTSMHIFRTFYLAEENRILRNQIKGRLRLHDAERRNLAKIGQRLGFQALAEVTQIVRPETALAWHRRLVAK